MSAITIKIDLRSLFGPARDQGQRPTCLIFAASDTHAALRNPWAPLSCEYIFYHAQKLANRPPTMGATLPHVLEAIRNEGQPVESSWAYLTQPPADISQWVPPAGLAPLFRRNSETKAAVDQIIVELNQGKPLMVLMYLSSSFFSVPSTGVIEPGANESPNISQRHAVVAVGHGEIGGQRAILIRNSWGNGWGDKGYAWLTEQFLLPRVFKLGILKEDISVHPITAAA